MNFMSLNVRGMGAIVKVGWVSGLRKDHKINFLAIQETQVDMVSHELVAKLWGNSNFSMEYVGASGRSGGLVCIWDPLVFRVQGVTKNRNYLLLNGQMVGSNQFLNVVNVYAPHRVGDKKVVWNKITNEISTGAAQWVLLGDFNAVGALGERLNSVFNRTCAKDFNDFISDNGLVEYGMKGRRYTFLAPNSNKLSKIVTPRFPRVSPVGPVGDYRDVVGNNIVKPHNI
ncbi:putative AP endonuclease 1, Endonuclease/exonuclease/phosphatase superfamily [Helianthus annuus]|nr:putative AP endonuclease 1, Endonuclease/exonuclease/phosphatase superfamily [Helianthus annuus]KAJ0529069.1 putative AP endonuclease 1, Endonuclease/exonuclease/phosphatase superfamily [Helianthus annuus]